MRPPRSSVTFRCRPAATSRRRRSRAAGARRLRPGPARCVLHGSTRPTPSSACASAVVLVVVDRLPPSDATRGDSADAVATAFNEVRALAVAARHGDRRRFRPSDLLELRRGRAGAHADPVLVQTTRGAPAPGQWLRAVLEYTNRSSCRTQGKCGAGALDPWPSRATRPAPILREAARAKESRATQPWKD